MAEDELSFEFEAQLNNNPQHKLLTNSALDQRGDLVLVPPQEIIGQQPGNFRKNYKKTVCTYWLRGMCMKGDQCGFLHQYDVDKMPICRNLLKYGECKELDCPYKHNTEEIKECNMYKLGFCIYGPTCRYKHKPAPGPPPKVETVEAAKPKDYRDINTVVNWANPGVMNAKEHEALLSLGMGAGLRKGGTSMGGGRRRFGWDGSSGAGGQQQQQQRGEEGGPQQAHKRARMASVAGTRQNEAPSSTAAMPGEEQTGGGMDMGQLQGPLGGQGAASQSRSSRDYMGHMPGILPSMGGGLPMPGMPPLMSHTQQHHPQQADMAMPPLMGMPQLAGLSAPMHPGLLMQLGLLGGMPGLQ